MGNIDLRLRKKLLLCSISKPTTTTFLSVVWDFRNGKIYQFSLNYAWICDHHQYFSLCCCHIKVCVCTKNLPGMKMRPRNNTREQRIFLSLFSSLLQPYVNVGNISEGTHAPQKAAAKNYYVVVEIRSTRFNMFLNSC